MDLIGAFNSMLPPFNLGQDPRKFFLWLWEVLVSGEAVDVGELEQYREEYNFYEPLRLATIERDRKRGKLKR